MAQSMAIATNYKRNPNIDKKMPYKKAASMKTSCSYSKTDADYRMKGGVCDEMRYNRKRK